MKSPKQERLDLTNPIFSDPHRALTYLEGVRWPNGRICPKCGEANHSSLVRSKITALTCTTVTGAARPLP